MKYRKGYFICILSSNDEKKIIYGFALGVPEMVTPVAAGIIEKSNGLQIPFSLYLTYLAGPDTVHMNVIVISGNKKTR